MISTCFVLGLYQMPTMIGLLSLLLRVGCAATARLTACAICAVALSKLTRSPIITPAPAASPELFDAPFFDAPFFDAPFFAAPFLVALVF